MTVPLGSGLLSGGWGVGIVATYLAALLVIGWLGRRASRTRSLSDFFLADRGLGTFVLLLTMFATQYSGNTLVGMSGNTYRVGYSFLVSVPMFVGLLSVAMLLAPGLHRLGRRHRYITLGDAIQHRFRSRTLTTLVALVGVWALVNFLVSNLIAVGYLVERATDGAVSREWAIVSLALVMLIYETLGGLRAVAWTDVLQGVMIGAGILILSASILVTYGGPGRVCRDLSAAAPHLLASPDWQGKLGWASTLLLIGIGAAIYPQAVQRYYAARDDRALRWSLRWMLIPPFFVAAFAVLAGLVGRAEFPALDDDQSERITLLLLSDLTAQSPGLRPCAVLFLTAVLAAIMSTVDSVLLALSATATQDFYRPWRSTASQGHLTLVGKVASWALMAGAVALALTLSQSVWRLIEIKLEVLIQAAPAVYLALYGRRARAVPVIVGLVVGVLIAVAPIVSPSLAGGSLWPLPERWYGLHSGVIGLLVNIATVAAVWPWAAEDPRPVES